MLSTLHARENDPHDALEIAPDVVFSARADRPSPTLAPDALGPAADRQGHIGSSTAAPSLDATFRATAADNRHVLREPSQARAWTKRALIGFLFAIGSAFAAGGWQHYGDRATSVIADWMPPFALNSPAPANPPESASPPVLQTAVVTEASSQATSPAPDAAAMPSSVSDQTQLIQSMAARRCYDGATDRAVEGEHHRTQGWPGADVARDGKDSRSQGVRVEPAPTAITAAAAPGRDSANAKTASDILSRANHSGSASAATGCSTSRAAADRAGTASDHAAGR